MPFQNEIAGGQGTITRPGLQSEDYVPGVSGWRIFRNGNAEFNDGTFRGTVTASTFEGTEFIISPDGAFFYDGTPALNNLIASIAPQPGTDSFGNDYLNGICSYDTDGNTGTVGYIQIVQQSVFIGDVNGGVFQSTADAGNFSGNANMLNIFTPKNPGNATNTADQVWARLLSGASGVLPGGANVPHWLLADALGTSFVDLLVSGALRSTNVAGTPTVWQTVANGGLSLGTGWANGGVAGGTQTVQYRRDALDNLVIVGTIHSTSATPSSTLFSVKGQTVVGSVVTDVGWRPQTQQTGAIALRVSPTNTMDIVAITPAGVVALETAVAATNTDVNFLVTVPLGNIP